MYMITEQVSLQIDLFFPMLLSWCRALSETSFRLELAYIDLMFKHLCLAEAQLKVATLLLK